MPLSDRQYAKLRFLLQDHLFRFLSWVTETPQKTLTPSHSMSIIKLENLLKSHGNKSLDKIIQRAQNMDSLTGALQAGLPADLAANLVAANVREDGNLVLVCSSPAWASRLRFETDQLIEIARKTGANVSDCSVRVIR